MCIRDSVFAPEIPISPLDATRQPNITTVTGEAMRQYGYRIIDYRLASGRWMIIYFIVTDATHPILSLSAMRKAGYGITVDHVKTLLTYMGHPRAELHDAHGLYFVAYGQARCVRLYMHESHRTRGAGCACIYYCAGCACIYYYDCYYSYCDG